MNEEFQDFVEGEVLKYLVRRSELHLEAAIGSMLDCTDPEEVAARLRAESEMLLEYG